MAQIISNHQDESTIELMLPHHPDFYFWLSLPPPSPSDANWVADAAGNLRIVDFKELLDYMEGGEYDEVIESHDDLILELSYD